MWVFLIYKTNRKILRQFCLHWMQSRREKVRAQRGENSGSKIYIGQSEDREKISNIDGEFFLFHCCTQSIICNCFPLYYFHRINYGRFEPIANIPRERFRYDLNVWNIDLTRRPCSILCFIRSKLVLKD